jgi:hypothetical protein
MLFLSAFTCICFNFSISLNYKVPIVNSHKCAVDGFCETEYTYEMNTYQGKHFINSLDKPFSSYYPPEDDFHPDLKWHRFLFLVLHRM